MTENTTERSVSAAPPQRKRSAGNRAVIAAMLANIVIAVAKFGAAILTGSSALLSEGIHSSRP